MGLLKKSDLLFSSVELFKKHINSRIIKYVNPERFRVKIKYPQLPERFKGTIIEKWSEYWQNLFRDYVEVIKDTASSAKQQPKKTISLLTLFGAGMYCSKNNPDEMSYRDAIISSTAEMMFVGPLVRNPRTVQYLKDIENSYNEGTLHRLSFGLFSIIWRDDYNECLGIYKAQCEYLGVPFYRSYERIVDIGFMNKWFILDKNMEDYDVNPEEWKNTEEI